MSGRNSGCKELFLLDLENNSVSMISHGAAPIITLSAIFMKACVRYFLSNLYFFHQMLAL